MPQSLGAVGFQRPDYWHEFGEPVDLEGPLTAVLIVSHQDRLHSKRLRRDEVNLYLVADHDTTSGIHLKPGHDCPYIIGRKGSRIGAAAWAIRILRMATGDSVIHAWPSSCGSCLVAIRFSVAGDRVLPILLEMKDVSRREDGLAERYRLRLTDKAGTDILRRVSVPPVGASSRSTGSSGAIIVIQGNERVFGELRKLKVELITP